MNTAYSSGVDVTSDVTTGRTSATAHISGVLARIKLANPQLNAFTDVVESRALAAATEIDRRRAAGSKLGPLAGVPFAVKNMIDIANVRTRAGSKINSDERVPASCDATLVRRLESVGAILVGSLNMGEYAYDFTGENAHYGPSRNPHDLSRMTGGSSGGGRARRSRVASCHWLWGRIRMDQSGFHLLFAEFLDSSRRSVGYPARAASRL